MISIAGMYAGGVLTLLMALFHCRFYSLFRWKDVFSGIPQLNARVLYTIHLALLLLFFALGAITLLSAEELSRAEGVSLPLTVSLSLFWLWRFLWQLVHFRRGKGRRVSPLELILPAAFFLLFVSYGLPSLCRFFTW
ncbi:MAG TPA: hypothetical protein PK907_00840 [Candidatus Sabulitectum sp.]|nr:hypothetical protein [Candidatus Sabulitectum sp.]HPR22602.1 hypothetical protein [Candidatus Sabulitectum sp.]